jgi:hypothetical protein
MGQILEQWTVSPGAMKGVRFHDSFPEDVSVGVLVRSKAMALWVNATDVEAYQDKTRAMALKIAQAYRPLDSGGSMQDWFFLAQGAIALPFEDRERAEASFGKYPGFEFEIEMETTREPKPGLVERFMTALANLGARMVQPVSMAKQGSRVVAGLKGDEVLLRDAENRKLSFTWLYPGTPNSGAEPEISLSMDADESKRAEAQALWDQLLNSMQHASK